jgi:hydroxylaminobenzene mutase
MNPIPQQLLICGTVLFLLSLLIGFAIPLFANPRMGVEMHVTGLQSGMALWALGLMWQRVALPAGAERPAQILAVAGLYAIFISLLLAALWGTRRATPIAGAGHQASHLREVVPVLFPSGATLSGSSHTSHLSPLGEALKGWRRRSVTFLVAIYNQ